VGELERKRSLEKRRCMWMYNIKVDLKELGWDGVDWIELSQDRDSGGLL
jgi:hypothetical protein